MNRRQFLRAAAATTVAPLVLPNIVSAADEKSDDRLILCAPLTHSDWMLKPAMAGKMGEAGVRHMLEVMKADLDTALGLTGSTSIADVGRSALYDDGGAAVRER